MATEHRDDNKLRAQSFRIHLQNGLHSLNSAAFCLQRADERNTYVKKLQSFEKFIDDLPVEAFDRVRDETDDTTQTQPGA